MTCSALQEVSEPPAEPKEQQGADTGRECPDRDQQPQGPANQMHDQGKDATDQAQAHEHAEEHEVENSAERLGTQHD